MKFNSLIVVLPNSDEAELFVDNLTAIMSEEMQLDRIVRHVMGMYTVNDINDDPHAQYILGLCELANGCFPDIPLENIAIDTVDLIDGNRVTVSVAALPEV